MIQIKTADEIAAMREGGKILAEILHELATTARIGMTTRELNGRAEILMARNAVIPSFKGYRGYPAVICTSLNEEVVHSIPGNRAIRDGDILSIDCGIIYKNFHTDAAVAIMFGKVDPAVRKFVNTVQEALTSAIEAARPGAHVGDIGNIIYSHITSNGYSIVREFIGHGVGRSLHEPPEVPNEGKPGHGPALKPGMTLAIEPIVAMGKRFIDTKKDGWTAVTRDSQMACQIEHTVAITPAGCEVITKYNDTINCIYAQ